MVLHEKSKDTFEIVLRQLNAFWPTMVDEQKMLCAISQAIEKTVVSYNDSNTTYYLQRGFTILNTTVYAVFLYHLAHIIGLGGEVELADKLYYLNKIIIVNVITIFTLRRNRNCNGNQHRASK